MSYYRNVFIDLNHPPPADWTLIIGSFKCQCSKHISSIISPLIEEFQKNNSNAQSYTLRVPGIPTETDLKLISLLLCGFDIFVIPSIFFSSVMRQLKISPTESLIFDTGIDEPLLYLLQEFEKLMIINFCIQDALKTSASFIVQTNLDIFYQLFANGCYARHGKLSEYEKYIQSLNQALSEFHYFPNFYDKLQEYNIKKKIDFSFENEEFYKSANNDPSDLKTAIINDDIEAFQKLVTTFEKFICDKPILFLKNPDRSISLIEYTAFFGSLRCFKYLILNKTKTTGNLMEYAVMGGNVEIIHICEQNNCSSKNSVEAAIEFHHQEIFEWLYNTKGVSINTEKMIEKCIKYNNFTTLLFLFNDNKSFLQMFLLNETFLEKAVISENFILVKLFLEKNKSLSIKSVTPLHFACRLRGTEIVLLLLKSKKFDLAGKTFIEKENRAKNNILSCKKFI